VQVAKRHPHLRIGRKSELRPVAGHRLGHEQSVAGEVVELGRVHRGVGVSGDRRVGDPQPLGGHGAPVLHALPDDQVGPPLVGQRQQVGDHPASGDVGQGQHGPGGKVRARRRHRRERVPGRSVGHQPVEAGVDVLKLEGLDLGPEGRRRGDGDVVPRIRERASHRHQRVEMASRRVNGEQDAHTPSLTRPSRAQPRVMSATPARSTPTPASLRREIVRRGRRSRP
jgi:hypothetical protein